LIVIDSSAIVAIFLREPSADGLRAVISRQSGCLLSVANYVETGQVLRQRFGPSRNVLDEFHLYLADMDIMLAPVDEPQARVARDARIRYGRGFGHPAKLNYSDCFAYALAKVSSLPLLYVGDDFTHTDIVSALA
jgi:ribonuclease VapC